MRLPGAVLLIALGLVLLWVASTGRLDRMSEAWQYLSGDADALPDGGGVQQQLLSNTPSPLDSILHDATFHVGATQRALLPALHPSPGGMLS